MSDDLKQAAWAQAWETYQRRKKENQERDAFRAGYETASMRKWFERGLLIEGSIGWAVERLKEGRAVKRPHWRSFIPPGAGGPNLTSQDLYATDWEVAEIPDSPCDSP